MVDANYIKSWGSIIDVNEMNKALQQLKDLDNIAPSPKHIFDAFKLCNYNNLKCIILGMDPYPQKGVATGLAFANHNNSEISPSLKVIQSSLYLNLDGRLDVTLKNWAEQGVLLLNSALTVELNKPGSHAMIWRNFIISVLKNLSDYSPGLPYILFGNTAKTFLPYINKNNKVILERHPSYYASCNALLEKDVFTEVNEHLYKTNGEKIEWLKQF